MRKMGRRELLKAGTGLGVASVLIGPRTAFAAASSTLHRWDIVNIFGGCIQGGGEASSKALDGARITVTGSGTFRDSPGHPQNVSGGGTYVITAGTATPASSGTYEVVRFVSFDPALGAPPPIDDCIGDPDARHAGRLTVAIRFDDGSEGVLEVGCRLVGSPGSIMEGITATKGFVTFWNHEEPAPGVEGNRTLFHRL